MAMGARRWHVDEPAIVGEGSEDAGHAENERDGMKPTVELAELASRSAAFDEAAKKPFGEVAPARLAVGARPQHIVERWELSE